MKLKHGPYSPSRLDVAVCPYSFYNQYISPNRKRGPSSLAADRGSAVHEVVEKITAELKKDRNTVFDRVTIQQWANEAIKNNPAALEAYEEVVQICHNYINHPPEQLTDDAEIELKLAVKLALDENGIIEVYKDIMYEGEENEEEVLRTKLIPCGYDDPDAIGRGRADIFIVSLEKKLNMEIY